MSIKHIYLFLIISLCNNVIFAMDLQLIQSNDTEKIFTLFSKLTPELQNKIFDVSDNKTNMKHVNKEWNQKKSIGATDIFTYVHLSKKKLTCILLNAVYFKNYQGVNNILQQTNFLAITKDRLPYFHIGNHGNQAIVLDPFGLVSINNDRNMGNILNNNKVPSFIPGQTTCFYIPAVMACLNGDSLHLQEIITNNQLKESDIAYVCNIIIDCDRVKCFNVLCNNQNIYLKIKPLVNPLLLNRACMQKSINILKELLALAQNNADIAKSFDLNKVSCIAGDSITGRVIDNSNGGVFREVSITQLTYLDKILGYAKEDPDFNEVAEVLKSYGAKTAKENLSFTEQIHDQLTSLSVFKKRVIFGLFLCAIVGLCTYLLK